MAVLMFVGSFTVFSVCVLAGISKGISDGLTTSDDFHYTACLWQDSKCIQKDTGQFISNEDVMSDWPSGPYVLLTPNDGCPESFAKGWRRGYISLTWKRRHTLMSATVCNIKQFYSQSFWETTVEPVEEFETNNCLNNVTENMRQWRNLTQEMWPEIESVMLGPFSVHALTINFCFKIWDKTDVENYISWPEGSYTIFGARNTCPHGFTSSERQIMLPAISTWTSYGFLPDFTIKTRAEDDKTFLTLKTCDHKTVDITSNQYFNRNSFVFIQTDQMTACPQFLDKELTTEALGLREDDNWETQELFTVCSYTTGEQFIGSDPHLYDPEITPYSREEYVISNPTLIYGNGKSGSTNSFSRISGAQLFSRAGDKWETVPWLLIDLGRHMPVVGVEFTEFYLTEIGGKDYQGTKNVSLLGYPCQRWDSQSPHSHGMVGNDQFPDKTVSDAENYCRDPDGTGYIWCYLQTPFSRWYYCAIKVYRFQKYDRPFSKCFISDDRWMIDKYGAVSCFYTVSYQPGILRYSFLKELGGRYVKLVVYMGTASSSFHNLVRNVKVVTTASNLHNESFCNSDLGMGDESIQDFQFIASSWLPQFPPSYGRPFYPGWCSSAFDDNPYITVDLLKNTKIDGITVFNWERVKEEVISGLYKKTIVPVGSKKIMVSYSTDLNKSRAHTNMTYSLAMYLPIEQPQKFTHNPVVARYVTVFIVESMTADEKCLRFELHGCKQTGARKMDLPSLISNTWILSAGSLYHSEELITFTYAQVVTNTSVLSSFAYSAHFPLGVSYTWIIDLQGETFIQLIFLNMTFNIYEMQAWEQCSDTLTFLPGAYYDKTMIIDQTFNDFVFILDTSVSYAVLTFTTCRPTSKIQSVGKGFKTHVKPQEVPTCLSLEGNKHNKLQNHCSSPMMYLTSIARQNFPDNVVTEEWIINVARFSIHLEILYFNIRCDTGSLFSIFDRFSGGKQYCNLHKAPLEMYSDSDTIKIRFVKDRDATEASAYRLSAREGFKAIYRTLQKTMAHLIDSHKTLVKAVLKLENLENKWESCSKRFGKCYSIYSGAQTSWATAGAECWIRQMRLVSIHSDEEHELVKYILRNFRYVEIGPKTLPNAFTSDNVDPNYFTHIGLSRVTSKSGRQQHLWEDGSPVTFSAWKAGEPSVNKGCTRMSFHLLNTNNTWEAEDCEQGSTSYFICEQPLTPKLLNISETATHLYNGTLNQTFNGIPCQRWDSQTPHQHSLFPDKNVSGAENYCRDWFFEGTLWCFTENPDIVSQECFVEEIDDFQPRLYEGYLSTTDSGRTCQRWEEQFPHKHSYGKINYFPDKKLDMVANHCRDPSNYGTLWCYSTDPKKEQETCKFKDTASDRCYLTHSQYTGKWNKTLSGEACQPWASQTPHYHESFQDSQFPDRNVTEASNFCRDPYDEGFLWCFTMDPATKTEPCVFEYKYSIEDKIFNDAFLNLTFQCYNGEKIPRQYVCNGIPNCLDVTDELNCTGKVHTLMKNRAIPTELQDMNQTLFHCGSNEWLSSLARCDGVIDCSDATDELNCSFNAEHGCSTQEYTCDDGECIHISQMCDFVEDCRDASDENCDFPQCKVTEYRCQNQQCIPIENRCDAFENCLDGTDEVRCDVCKANTTFHCDFVRCIPQRLVCDNYPDCEDGSDEMSCDQSIHNSCEEWWTAGYRKSGLYKLNGTDSDIECNFDKVLTERHIYTIFHNCELTARYGVEVIHYTFNESDEGNNYINDRFFTNSSYTCTQNITQSCIPAYKAAADNEDLDHTDAYGRCDCLVLTVVPGRYDINLSSVVECEGSEKVTDMDRMFFRYREYKSKRNITLTDSFPRGVEITLGPAICKHVSDFVETNIGCEDGNVYPASVRCVYDTDPAGYLLGCRSGQHLQNCEPFECPANTVKCPGSFCLPLKFICDGVRHCPGAQDEKNCGCVDADREVLLLYENRNNVEENREFRKIASQFYTTNSVVRELRYRLKTIPDKLDFEHIILDISDVEINPYSTIDRQYVCNYSILASDFINRIQFKKIDTTAVIFLQKGKDSGKLSKMILGNLKSRPKFSIYRVIEKINNAGNNIETFPFVQNVFVKRITMLNTFAAELFPDVCPERTNVYCPQEFRCAKTKTCIPLEQVCDGYAQCVYGDDERMCNYSCPEKCECTEYTTKCSFSDNKNFTLTNLNKKSRWIDLSGNSGLEKSLSNTWLFPYLISLNLSNCAIDEIRASAFRGLLNLRILDLSFNRFSKIPSSAFTGLRRLKFLNIFGNRVIYSLEEYSLKGLSSLNNFEIKGSNISKLSKNVFSGLTLNQLVFSENIITDMEDGAFEGLSVKLIDIEKNTIANFDQGLFQGVSGVTSLRAPAFKFCCVRPNYLGEENCYPEKDEFSSCDDLLRHPALQTMLWLIGIVALFGNVLSITYRLVYDRERVKMGYGIFVTNLAVADFLMGIYLIIIAIADAIFRKRYIFLDDFWRNSVWCTVAGFLSTVSSEASVFFLCLITLDRLFVIKYPFGQVRFDTKKSGVACLISWVIATSVGLIPILHTDYFHGRFYSKSGVCIALPLTRDQPPGWLYSVIVFVGLNFITFCLIGIGQIAIYLEIKKSTSGIRHSSSERGKAGTGRRRELTVARNLLLVVATDFMCWFPIGCMGMLSLSGHVIPGEVYAWTAVFILPVNAALNPVLYTLMAIIGKRTTEQQTNNSFSSVRAKQVEPFNGLFRYFITRSDSLGQTFVSLNDVLRENISINAIDVLNISLHLTRSLRLLHRSSLVMTKLDGNVVYTNVKFGKITGDIQLRQEPIVCRSREEKGDNMDMLGQLIRCLLAKRNKQIIAKNKF